MSDPDSFPTLQSIVLHEVQTDVAQVRNSATEALLWLRRGLKFLKEFLSEVNTGRQDIQGALSKSGCYGAQSDIYKQVQINVRQCIVHKCITVALHHVLCTLNPRWCIWKDPPAVPRMGCARSICCRYFFLTSAFPFDFLFLMGVFCILLFSQLALRAAPSYQSFNAALVSREGDELKSGFTSSMHRDLGVYLPAMEKHLAILDVLYEEYNLESDEVVWELKDSGDSTSRKSDPGCMGRVEETEVQDASCASCVQSSVHVPCQYEMFLVVVQLCDNRGSGFEDIIVYI